MGRRPIGGAPRCRAGSCLSAERQGRNLPSPVGPTPPRCGHRRRAGDRLGKPRDMEAVDGQLTGRRSSALPARVVSLQSGKGGVSRRRSSLCMHGADTAVKLVIGWGSPAMWRPPAGSRPGRGALRCRRGGRLHGMEAVVGQANGRGSLAALNKDELSLLLFTLMIDHAFVMSDPTGEKDQPIVR